VARKTKEETEETRRSILDAALDVLSEKGFSQTSFVDIADRIGMTKGAVYWHFKDKQALLAALTREMHKREQILMADQAAETVMLDGLAAYLARRVAIATRDKQFRKFAFFVLLQMEWSADMIAAVREKLATFREEPFDEVNQILDRARQRGELRRDVDLATAKDMLMSMWVGLLTTHFQQISTTDPVETAEKAFDVFIQSLKA
jgi:TetR/AcrR family transcriptional regulator, acrAB operon repressor